MTEVSGAAAPTRSSATAEELSRAVVRLRAAGCVFAEDEAALLLAAGGSAADGEARLVARCSGQPLEQVLGWAQFCEVRVAVSAGVFVPRRRSECLVRAALAGAPPVPVVLDLCCGTGALGLVIALARPGCDLHAVDLDPAAVACARRNLIAVGGQVHLGELYEPLPLRLRGTVDILVAVPPYVPSGELALLPREARLYESRAALDGGTDGLDVVRALIAGAVDWLTPGGRVLLETSAEQSDVVAAAMRGHHLQAVVAQDENLEGTVVIGRL